MVLKIATSDDLALVRSAKLSGPTQTYWISNSRDGVQQSVFLKDLQMIVLHTQVWEPPI